MSNTDATPVTAEEELERIALTDTDSGVLARILLGRFHDVPDVMDSVPADSVPAPAPAPFPPPGTTGPAPFPPPGTTGPVTAQPAPEPAPVPDSGSSFPPSQEAPVVAPDSGQAPGPVTEPVGGNPAAPNTTIGGTSEEGSPV